MLEVWDAYNSEFEKLEGIELIRGLTIPDHYYHLVVDIVVKHIDGTYLLMQRDLRKHLGGLWELSAGGSALKGEDGIIAANRELLEETGIIPIKMDEIGRTVHQNHHSIYLEYLAITDCKKDSICLQAGETINYQWIDEEKLIHFPKENLASTRILNFMKLNNQEGD